MSPEQYVSIIYRLALGRAPDPAGLAAHVSIANTAERQCPVLISMLKSAEYIEHTNGKSMRVEQIDTCLGQLSGNPIIIVDVGAQILEFENHVYGPLCRPNIPHRVIGFEPLAHRLEERQSIEGDSVELLPFAIGDGREHTLYINNFDATSSLYPLDLEANSQFEHLSTLKTVERRAVQTHTLDQMLDGRYIDFMKLDIQGAEFMALEHATASLQRTGVVHCEVEFVPLYEGQKLFCDVNSLMSRSGFTLIDLIIPHRYSYITTPNVDSRDRLLWGEAVFFRETKDFRTLASQALIAGVVYKKVSLAAHLLQKLAQVLEVGSPPNQAPRLPEGDEDSDRD